MLNEEQKQKVSAWIADGVKLSDIQSRLGSECDVRLTYMEVRLLVDDLKLTPKDPVVEVPVAPVAEAVALPAAEEIPSPAGSGQITLTADEIPRPGTMASGSVTFSDGKTASWYLDQTGRLGVVPEDQAYRPPTGDVEKFQAMLDQQLAKMGF